MRQSLYSLSAVSLALALGACGKKDTPVVVVPAATAPAAAVVAAPPADASVIKIGHVAPTSGGIAHLGKDNEMGARMAIEELNAKGVTIGGKKVTFQ